MGDIGDRLKEERTRLGLSQEALGEIGGVRKGAQFNYEAGVRSPDAEYLKALAATGVDVAYIITGIRTVSAASESLPPGGKVEIVTEEEAEILEGYRELGEQNRRLLRRAVAPPARDSASQVGKKRANSK